MHGSVGEVEKEVPALLLTGLHEFHGLLGVFASYAALAFILEEFRDLFVPHQRMNALAIRGGSAAHVIRVGNTKVAVEAVARGQEFPLISKMPLTHTHGSVAEFFEVVGYGVLLRVEPVAASRKKYAGYAYPGRVTAGH